MQNQERDCLAAIMWRYGPLRGRPAAGLFLLALPRRLRTRLDERGIELRWAFGRRAVAWPDVKRLVIGPLGSGGERDPLGVTLILRTGEEILFTPLGRTPADRHPAAGPLLEAAQRAGVPVEDVTAPPEERSRRAREWREARMKGWR